MKTVEKSRPSAKRATSASSATSIARIVAKANAPYGALAQVYRKGLGAFNTGGSRTGASPEAWAMARVNSVLTGGKARQVDAKQWKTIQAHRKKKRGK